MEAKDTKRNCQACLNIQRGVKTRKSVPHTCKTTMESFLGGIGRQIDQFTDVHLKDVSKEIDKFIKLGDDFINKISFRKGDKVILPFNERGVVVEVNELSLDWFKYKVKITKATLNKVDEVIECRWEDLKHDDEKTTTK